MTHSSAKRTGGYTNGRARRQQILEAATVLFGEVGYRSASLREIAARAGISHPGLLHHFPTKEALLLAILKHRDEIDSSALEEQGTDALARLRQLIALVERNVDRRIIVELYVSLSAEATSQDHPAHAFFVERYQTTLNNVAHAYQLARDEDVLREAIDPATAAAQLVALMDGLQIQWLLDGGITDMPAILRAHVQAQLTARL